MGHFRVDPQIYIKGNSIEDKPSGSWGYYMFSYFVYLSALAIMITWVKNVSKKISKKVSKKKFYLKL